VLGRGADRDSSPNPVARCAPPVVAPEPARRSRASHALSAPDRETVVGPHGAGLAQSGIGPLAWLHRTVAPGTRSNFVPVVERHRCEASPHAPLDVARQHAEQDGRARATSLAVTDPQDLEVDRLQGPECRSTTDGDSYASTASGRMRAGARGAVAKGRARRGRAHAGTRGPQPHARGASRARARSAPRPRAGCRPRRCAVRRRGRAEAGPNGCRGTRVRASRQRDGCVAAEGARRRSARARAGRGFVDGSCSRGHEAAVPARARTTGVRP